MKVVIFLILLLSSSLLKTQTLDKLTEEQIQTPEKKQNISEIFWSSLYPTGGWSLYCGIRFNHLGKTEGSGNIVIGQIFPYEKILEHYNCTSIQQCASNDPFNEINTDLHNLYPVWSEITHTQRDHSYGLIENEDWRYQSCDYEKFNKIIEPREIARGNIARAIFYMIDKYHLTINTELQSLLSEWNYADLPSEHELKRNNLIEKIQGDRNPYIDNPKLIKTNHTD